MFHFAPSAPLCIPQWAYTDFFGIAPNTKSQQVNEFVINIRKGKKTESMRFSTEYRPDVLTEALVSDTKES